MPQCCAVPMCSNKIGGHRFPKDELRLKQWLLAIRRDFTPSIHSIVCKSHFTMDDYELPKDSVLPNPRLVLKKNAVPSIFPWTEENYIKGQFIRGSRKQYLEISTETPTEDSTAKNSQQEQEATIIIIECRTCLTEIQEDKGSFDLLSAWNPHLPGMGLSMAEDLATIAGIQISKSDAYSKLICSLCCKRLQDAVSFRHSVQNSDLNIRRRQMNSSDNKDGIQHIQIIKSVSNGSDEYMEMEIEIKQEVLTEDDCNIIKNDGIRERSFEAHNIKIEQEEKTKSYFKFGISRGGTDCEYESGAPGPSTKNKFCTETGHKNCVTTYSRQTLKPSETQSSDNKTRRLKTQNTSAERGREFRARGALLKQQQKPAVIIKIATEDVRNGPSEGNQVPGPSEIRTKEKREMSAEATRKDGLWGEKRIGVSEPAKKGGKTAAQRMREYRERKKMRRCDPNVSRIT